MAQRGKRAQEPKLCGEYRVFLSNGYRTGLVGYDHHDRPGRKQDRYASYLECGRQNPERASEKIHRGFFQCFYLYHRGRPLCRRDGDGTGLCDAGGYKRGF